MEKTKMMPATTAQMYKWWVFHCLCTLGWIKHAEVLLMDELLWPTSQGQQDSKLMFVVSDKCSLFVCKSCWFLLFDFVIIGETVHGFGSVPVTYQGFQSMSLHLQKQECIAWLSMCSFCANELVPNWYPLINEMNFITLFHSSNNVRFSSALAFNFQFTPIHYNDG